MSYNIFFAADHHCFHSKPHDTFTRADGRFLRYEFPNAEDCVEAMVDRHNSVVKDNDRVYFVGDFCFHKKHLYVAGRMRGRKVLIKGNHDLLDAKDYLQYFDDIRGVHQFKGMIISHIPIHEQSLARWGFNVHGHLHGNRVMMPGSSVAIDQRYFNVSVEQINYTPISLEEVRKFSPV